MININLNISDKESLVYALQFLDERGLLVPAKTTVATSGSAQAAGKWELKYKEVTKCQRFKLNKLEKDDDLSREEAAKLRLEKWYHDNGIDFDADSPEEDSSTKEENSVTLEELPSAF